MPTHTDAYGGAAAGLAGGYEELFHPISSIPNEILREIFVNVAEGGSVGAELADLEMR